MTDAIFRMGDIDRYIELFRWFGECLVEADGTLGGGKCR